MILDIVGNSGSIRMIMIMKETHSFKEERCRKRSSEGRGQTQSDAEWHSYVYIWDAWVRWQLWVGRRLRLSITRYLYKGLCGPCCSLWVKKYWITWRVPGKFDRFTPIGWLCLKKFMKRIPVMEKSTKQYR